MNLRQAAQQARNALANARDYIYLLETGEVSWSEEEQLQEIAAAITALRAALAEPQTTHWEGCEAVHPECRAKTELERKSDAIQRLWKERDELRALNAELVEALRQIEPILARMYGAQAADLPPMQIVRAALAKWEAASK